MYSELVWSRLNPEFLEWKYKIYKKYVLKKDPILLEVTKINFLKPKVRQSTSAETSVQDNPIENYLTELQSK